MKTGLFCGFNGFRQFGTAHGRKTDGFAGLSEKWTEDDCKNYCFSWSFNAFSRGRRLTLSGFIKEVSGNESILVLPDDIKCVAASLRSCMVLLNNGNLFKVDVRTCEMEELNFISVERPPKRSIFGEKKEQDFNDPIDFMACGRYLCVAVTRSNSVYNVPCKVHEWPKHVRIKDLVCGFEHALALTANGDVYSWGNGLRGQLGHQELRIEEAPLMIEALAGVKMVAIAAGGWHSAAISSFGDLYIWGSNVNGQLGFPVYTRTEREGGDRSRRKNATVYALPQIFDPEICCGGSNDVADGESCMIVQVACGARHTFIRNECGRIYFSGWNEHGQFGKAGETRKVIDKFTELKLPANVRNCDIICGAWCSVLINDIIND